MSALWPETLPLPDREGYELRPQDVRRKRQSETGPPGYRRRFTSRARIVRLQMLLTADERVVFDRFHDIDCAMGSLPFRMPDPTTTGTLMGVTGTGVLIAEEETLLALSEVWLCLWGDGVPTETLRGRLFQKSFEVVVLP